MLISTSLLTQSLTLNKEFRIIPAGKFRAIDGRPGNNQDWELTESNARKIIAEVATRGQDCLIDYGHQSLRDSTALAAGWFKELIWKSDGLYVKNANWTDAAKRAIQAQEYRFVSPVFTHTPTFEVLGLLSIAITNTPALPQLTDLSQVSLSKNMGAGTTLSVSDADIQHVARSLGQCPIALKVSVLANEAKKVYMYSDREIERLAVSLGRDFSELKRELNNHSG